MQVLVKIPPTNQGKTCAIQVRNRLAAVKARRIYQHILVFCLTAMTTQRSEFNPKALVGAADTVDGAMSSHCHSLPGKECNDFLSLAQRSGKQYWSIIHLMTPLLDRRTQMVSIPSSGHVEALNVSVAAGVTLSEIVRQRSSAKGT